MSRSRPLVFGAALVTTFALAPRVASACSGPYCLQPADFVLPESGVVPANFGEITSYHAEAFRVAGTYDVRMWEEGAATNILKQGRMLATNDPPVFALGQLVEGKHYVVEATPKCVWGDGREETPPDPLPPQLFRFTAGPAHEAPQTLGPLRVVRQGTAAVPWGGGAGCWDNLEASAVELALDPSTLPEAWRELLTQYQLMVDGEPFAWTLSIGAGGGYALKDVPRGFYGAHPGVFQVWTRCGALPRWIAPDPEGKADGVKPGKHEVWVRARVPESTPSFIESAHVKVDLACPEAIKPDPTQVEPVRFPQEQVPPEPAEDDAAEEPSTTEPKAAGGDCSAAGGAPRAGWASWLAALGLAALLGRRRTGGVRP